MGLRPDQDVVHTMKGFSVFLKRIFWLDFKAEGFLSRKRLAATVYFLARKGGS